MKISVTFEIDNDVYVIADNNFEKLKEFLRKYGCENIKVEEIKEDR